jgi:hypothetical protein
VNITPELKAFAIEQAARRCECSGAGCRHHLKGQRCKRGLRGDQWKVYWRSEAGGVTRENIQAWCLECFANNFQAPRETVALLALDIVGFASLFAEDQWRAMTLKSALRDAARGAAVDFGGRAVLDRAEDDVLLELPTSVVAVEAARKLRSSFRDVALRLNVEVPEICGAIHCGEVTRWRSGVLVGDAVEVTVKARGRAGAGQLVVTASAAEPLSGKFALEPMAAESPEPASNGEIWALQL